MISPAGRAVANAALALLCASTVVGCGDSPNYSERFEQLIPPTWTLQSETGSIDDGGINRVYEIHETVAVSTTELAARAQQAQCRETRAGNGITVDCDDVHLAVSFSNTAITAALTKQ